MRDSNAASELRQMIAGLAQRIVRQERRVAKLSTEGGSLDPRDEAKAVLADMMVNRQLLETQLSAMGGPKPD